MKFYKLHGISFNWDEKSEEYKNATELASQIAETDYEETREEIDAELEDYLTDNPDKTKEDFCELYPSDAMYFKPFEEIKDTIISENRDLLLKNFYGIPKKDVTIKISGNVLTFEEINKSLEKDFGVTCSKVSKSEEARFNDYSKMMNYVAIKNLSDSSEFKKLLSLQSHLQTYSHYNIIKVFSQFPQATNVNGMKAWEKYGRKVDDTAKKIWILSPNKKYLKDENAINQYIDSRMKWIRDTYASRPSIIKERETYYAKLRAEYLGIIKKGQPVELLEGFRDVFVYDISQTTIADKKLAEKFDIKAMTFTEDKETVIKNVNAVIGSKFTIDATEKEIFNAIYDYADNMLTNHVTEIPSILDTEVFTDEKHTIETCFATNAICAKVGIESTGDMEVKLAEAFMSIRNNMLESKYDVFNKTYKRGKALADMCDKDIQKTVSKTKQKKQDDLTR